MARCSFSRAQHFQQQNMDKQKTTQGKNQKYIVTKNNKQQDGWTRDEILFFLTKEQRKKTDGKLKLLTP